MRAQAENGWQHRASPDPGSTERSQKKPSPRTGLLDGVPSHSLCVKEMAQAYNGDLQTVIRSVCEDLGGDLEDQRQGGLRWKHVEGPKAVGMQREDLCPPESACCRGIITEHQVDRTT